MRGRSGLLTAAGIFAALVLLAALLGRRNRGVIEEDGRSSTYVRGPAGASGLWEALPALGVRVGRLRERPRVLPADTGSGPSALLVLSPSSPMSSLEQRALIEYNGRASGGGDLVIAGVNAIRLLQCFGYDPQPMLIDSVRAFVPGERGTTSGLWTQAVLVRRKASRDSTPSMFLGAVDPCPPVDIARTDTLLLSSRGPAALLLERRESRRHVILVADGNLFRNRHLRESAAGPYLLDLLARRYARVTFDEYHHGYGPTGSLARAIAGWSARSPLGWAIWQAAIVGLLALLTAAVRFGPPRTVLQRRRRAPMEHVRALATALAAARGHDVAISVLVQGLRRRLAPAGRGTRATGDEAQWLTGLVERGVPRPARPALESLTKLMTPGQNEAAVLRAANDVEDVWDTLRHSAPASWRH